MKIDSAQSESRNGVERVPSRANTWPPAWLQELEEAPAVQSAVQAEGADPGPTSAPKTATGSNHCGDTGQGESWDQAAADRLVAEIHAGLKGIEWERYGGAFPASLRGAIDAHLEAVQQYVARRDMEMLRTAPEFAFRLARREFYYRPSARG